jgi:hypothetical protein
MVIDTLDGKFWGYYWFSGKPICCANSPITSILKPSEVVVDFGSGIKGTIERNNDYSDWLVINVWNEKRELIAIIFTQFLKPVTTDLVRELIAKQEENNG